MAVTLDQFNASLSAEEPPDDLPIPLKALWWDARGDWKRAHGCVDSLEYSAGMRVHAYLHRKEGDRDNAAYWYRQAGRAAPHRSLEDERDGLLRELLAEPTG